MSVTLIASSEPGVGRSLIAAAIAYRSGRDGAAVTLARLAGDDGAGADASAFAELDGIVTPGKPISADDAAKLTGDLVLEAPAGSVKSLAEALNARVIAVGLAASSPVDAPASPLAGVIVTRAPASDIAWITASGGVIAVLPEDRILAAPSVSDLASVLKARWLTPESHGSFDRVMIGTVSSDAASPYFGNRERTCVITRYDKTDIQLAALQTDIECLVMTGGGEPSPYLMDRVLGTRDEIAVILAPGSTVETMRAIEPLYGASRFEGAGKLARAVALLDEISFSLSA